MAAPLVRYDGDQRADQLKQQLLSKLAQPSTQRSSSSGSARTGSASGDDARLRRKRQRWLELPEDASGGTTGSQGGGEQDAMSKEYYETLLANAAATAQQKALERGKSEDVGSDDYDHDLGHGNGNVEEGAGALSGWKSNRGFQSSGNESASSNSSNDQMDFAPTRGNRSKSQRRVQRVARQSDWKQRDKKKRKKVGSSVAPSANSKSVNKLAIDSSDSDDQQSFSARGGKTKNQRVNMSEYFGKKKKRAYAQRSSKGSQADRRKIKSSSREEHLDVEEIVDEEDEQVQAATQQHGALSSQDDDHFGRQSKGVTGTDFMRKVCGPSRSNSIEATTLGNLLQPQRRESTSKSSFRSSQSSNNPISQCESLFARARIKLLNNLVARSHESQETEQTQASPSDNDNAPQSATRKTPRLELHIAKMISAEKQRSGASHVVQVEAYVLDVDLSASSAANDSNQRLMTGQKLRLVFPLYDEPEKNDKASPSRHVRQKSSAAATNNNLQKVAHHLGVLGHFCATSSSGQRDLVSMDDLRGCDVAVWWPWAFLPRSGVVIAQSLIHVLRRNAPAPALVLDTVGHASDTHPVAPGPSEDSDDDLVEGAIDLGDGWSYLTAYMAKSLGQPVVPHLTGRVECAVVRHALIGKNGERFVSDLLPPGSTYSSVLISRPATMSSHSGGQEKGMHREPRQQYCELLIPPQHFTELNSILEDDCGGDFLVTNARQVSIRQFRTALPSSHGSLRASADSSIQWDVFLSQQQAPRNDPTAMDLPVLVCDKSTRITRSAAPPKALCLEGSLARGDSSTSTLQRRNMMCRVIHIHRDELFVVDVSSQKMVRVLIVDADLDTPMNILLSKGTWIICRNVLFDPAEGSFSMDYVTVVEKAELGTGKVISGNGAQMMELRCAGETPVLKLPWIRLPPEFYQRDTHDDMSQQDCDSTAEQLRKATLGTVINHPDYSLQVPLMKREIVVPQSFDMSLQGKIESFHVEFEIPPRDQGERHFLLNVTARVIEVGLARKTYPSWRYKALSKEDSMTVGQAIELSRMKDNGNDVALCLERSNGSTLLVRTRDRDLVQLVGHASTNQDLLLALQALGRPVTLPLLLNPEQISILNSKEGSQQTEVYLTSLALVDEQYCDLVVGEM